MGQVTIYLEKDIEQKIKRAAKKAGCSLSKWFSNLAGKEVSTNWPKDIAEMAGTWNDFPSLKEIRSSEGKDLPRESL